MVYCCHNLKLEQENWFASMPELLYKRLCITHPFSIVKKPCSFHIPHVLVPLYRISMQGVDKDSKIFYTSEKCVNLLMVF